MNEFFKPKMKEMSIYQALDFKCNKWKELCEKEKEVKESHNPLETIREIYREKIDNGEMKLLNELQKDPTQKKNEILISTN
jgi:hypothetical protein